MTQISPLGALGRRLDEALHLIDAARSIPVTDAASRAAATYSIHELFAQASTKTRIVAANLDSTIPALSDARAAVESLTTNLDRVGRHHSITDARNGVRFVAAVDAVKHTAASFQTSDAHIASAAAAAPPAAPATLLDGIHAIATKADADVTIDDLQKLATIQELSKSRRGTLPAPVRYSF